MSGETQCLKIPADDLLYFILPHEEKAGEFTMNVIKSISRRIFLWTFFVMTILCALICAAFYSGKVFLLRVLPIDVLKDAAAHSDALDAGLKEMLPLVDMINAFFVPVACAVFFLFMLVLWVILRASAKRALKKATAAESLAPAPAKKEKKKNRSKTFWLSP
jgi:hypothetical protein